jgi:hypothetical protein
VVPSNHRLLELADVQEAKVQESFKPDVPDSLWLDSKSIELWPKGFLRKRLDLMFP